MPRFFKKLICLSLPFVLIAIYTEVNLRQIENGYSRKKKDFERQLAAVQVLTLGSSHTLFGIDPDQFRQRAFNMAYVSQSIYYDRMIVEQYVDRMPALEAVILPISYFSLDTGMAESTEQWRRYFYSRYFGFPVEGADNGALRVAFEPKQFSMIALYGIPKSLKHLRNNFKIDLVKYQQPNGWLKRELTKTFSAEEGKARVALHESLMFPGMRAKNLNHLAAISKVLQERNIALILVTPPAHKTYTDFVDQQKYESMVSAAKEFCADMSCTYVDLFTSDQYEDSDFFDRDHLNADGARKLSQYLDNLLNQQEKHVF